VRHFAPGDSVVWRSVREEERVVSFVWPMTVVHDEAGDIVLYLQPGTVGKQRTGRRAGPRDRILVDWDGNHRDVVWHDTSVLRLYREGDDYSIWLARDVTGALVWRYINLESPWRRTAIGFDSRDLYLDLFAERDSDDWHWKDEDELAWLVDQGRMDAALAAQVRASGERALSRVRAGDSMLSQWATWKPDRPAEIARLPPNWRDYDLAPG